MGEITTNGVNLYAQLAHRMRASLGEFDNPDRDLEGLVKELAEFKRAHLAQPAQAVDVGAIQEVIDGLASCARLTDYDLMRDTCQGAADKLTRAISTAPHDRALVKADDRRCLL